MLGDFYRKLVEARQVLNRKHLGGGHSCAGEA